MLRSLLLGFAAVALPMMSAAAAPATPEEAARLSSLFERYVGRPGPGEAPRAIVVPQGDDYLATVDLKRALAGLGALGLDLDPYTVRMLLTPRADGAWRVRSDDAAPLVARLGGETVTIAAKTSTFDGTFDPKLESFSAFKQDQTGAGTSRISPTLVQSTSYGSASFSGTGVTGDGGTTSTAARFANSGVNIDTTFKSAPPPPSTNPAVPPSPQAGTTLAFRTPATQSDLHVDRLDAPKVLDLWAFLAAHQSRDSVVAAQDDLKALLRAGLPYVEAYRQIGTYETPAVETPIGTVTAKSLGFGLDLSGLGGAGRAALSLSAADLAIPPGQLPPWSSGLVPTALDLHVAVDGFHAADAERAAVDAVDLGKDVIITPEGKAEVARRFWSGGAVTLGPSRIATKMLDLTLEGHAAKGDKLSGQLTVTAKGLDREIAALQAQAASDPGVGQVLGPLALAKGLAKPGPDGALVWVIAFGDGPVTVNGAPLQ